MIRRLIAAAIYVLTSWAWVFAETIDFYATVSTSTDAGMIKMSTDILYTQLQTMDGYTVIDRRNENYNPVNKSQNISFYTEIQEESSGSWTCTLNAFKGEAAFSSTKEYDSYYKILMDAKASLENFMLNLSGNIVIPGQESSETVSRENEDGPARPNVRKHNPIMDTIAGTWEGEELTDKILILRGGRGFIIFKNGATMNISVSVEGSDVTIKQKGKPNASFYPSLPRQDALKNAASASPIEWNFKLEGKTLTGIKKTLVSDKKSSTGVSEGNVNATWTKVH
ncbi:MAG: hypothetical protein KIG77_03655 [Treponema sp.]|uniref:TP0183 family DNA metabolism protein n=1 Tax=Treponema sp. TaxID=166 RepID=UPI001DD7D193|nr:hypothetical protein [Treponema sp.]MBS7241466.1 hypothetical protein [Treponema sp.]